MTVRSFFVAVVAKLHAESSLSDLAIHSFGVKCQVLVEPLPFPGFDQGMRCRKLSLEPSESRGQARSMQQVLYAISKEVLWKSW